MATSIQHISGYMDFYKYLMVLSEEQITKLRKIATGILHLSAFSQEEISMLETKITITKQWSAS